MKLHIVGTGCNAPSAHAYGSAFLLETGGASLLFDCGPGTSCKLARMGVSLTGIHHLFLTHHHWDHTADVPCFVLTRWDKSEHDQPALAVVGPPPTAHFIDTLFGPSGAFADDITARTLSPASLEYYRLAGGRLPRPRPAFDVREMGEGLAAEAEGWRVTCATVRHVDPVEGRQLLVSLAFRVDTEEGCIVFAGDCDDCPALRRLAAGADTLVVKPRAVLPLPFACEGEPDISGMGKALTTGTGEPLLQDGQLLAACAPRRVVLTHLAPGFHARTGMRERALATVGAAFRGVLMMPDELETISLGR